MVGLGPPIKAGSVNIPWPSFSSTWLVGLSSVGDTGESVMGTWGLEKAMPQALAARRTPGTSWTLAYHRRRWGSWSRALASRAWREHYQREEMEGGDKRKTGRYWLSDSSFLSSPLGREVRFQHNSLTTQLDRQEGARQEEHIKTLMAGGKNEVKESNEEQFKCMHVCVSVCGGQKKGRRTQTDSRRDSAGSSQSRAMWLEMAVNRRHARLSVKLETSGAQLTAVRTSVCSHRPGIRGRQQGELEAETHFTSQSIMMCDWTKQALCSLQTALDGCCCQVCTSYTTRMSAELLLQFPFGLQVFESWKWKCSQT